MDAAADIMANANLMRKVYSTLLNNIKIHKITKSLKLKNFDLTAKRHFKGWMQAYMKIDISVRYFKRIQNSQKF